MQNRRCNELIKTLVINKMKCLWEAKAGGSWGQKFKTSLANMLNSISTKNIKISWAWWWAPVVPATHQEAEAGEPLEPRGQRLQWAERAPPHSSPDNKARLCLEKNKFPLLQVTPCVVPCNGSLRKQMHTLWKIKTLAQEKIINTSTNSVIAFQWKGQQVFSSRSNYKTEQN